MGELIMGVMFLVSALLGLCVCLLAWGLYHKPALALWVVAGLVLVQTWVIALPPIRLGIFIYPADIVFGCIAAATLMRLLWGKQLQRIPPALVVLCAVFVLSLVLGLVKFGKDAGVECRGDFYFWVGVIYFLSFPVTKELLSSFARVWIVTAMAILLIVYYRWLAVALNLDWPQPIWVAAPLGDLYKYRVVNAGQALILGEALILLVYAMATGGGLRPWKFLIPLLAITVLVLQHRSAWVATFVPLLLAFVLLRNNRDKLVGNLAVLAMVTAIVVVPLLAGGAGSGVISSIDVQAERATNLSEGTSGDRAYGWKVLLNQWLQAGPVVYATGNPYGSGYRRYSEHGREIAYEPHNYYVQMLLRTGITGLACLLAIYWAGISWLRREQVSSHPDVPNPALVALLICQLLFFIPYSPHYSQGIILGIALSLVRDRLVGWRSPTIIKEKV